MSAQGALMGIYGKSYVRVGFKFFEFVSPLPAARNAITDWRNDFPTASRKADMDTFLRTLAKLSGWTYPDVSALSGKHLKGLHELRWRSDNVPHRIGGYFSGPNEFVMLVGFTHNKKKYDPPTALETLESRRKKLRSREATIREYHVITGR